MVWRDAPTLDSVSHRYLVRYLSYMLRISKVATFALLAACAGCDGTATVLQSSLVGDSGADAPTDASSDAAPPMNYGAVLLSSTNAPNAAPPETTSSVNAGFSVAPPDVCPPEVIVDGCSVIECFPPRSGAAPTVSAGTLVVSGAKQPLNLVPSGNEYLSPNTSASALWDGGEALDLVASGAVAPAFSLSLVTPKYVEVTSPTWPTGSTKLPIVRTNPLVVAWTGDTAGDVVVKLVAATKAGPVFLTCAYPATAGQGTVSTAVLAKLPPVAVYYSIEIVSRTRVQTLVDGWTMVFTAEARATTPQSVASRELEVQ